MSTEWQVKFGEKVHGPFSDQQLWQLLRTGRIDFDTPVRPSKNSIWRKAGDVTNLPTPEPAETMSADVQAAVDEVLLDKPKPVSGPWQMLDGERIVGPYTTEEFQRMGTTGKLTKVHRVRRMGTSTWEPAGQYSDFFTPIQPTTGTKPCPFCAEPIQIAAVKCKHCGEFLNGSRTVSRPVRHSTSHVVNGPIATWNPGVAAVLSFLFPGLGQMYKGQVGLGLLYFFVTIVGYMFFIVPGLLIHVWAIFDAFSTNPNS